MDDEQADAGCILSGVTMDAPVQSSPVKTDEAFLHTMRVYVSLQSAMPRDDVPYSPPIPDSVTRPTDPSAHLQYTRASDPRDARIAALEAELAALRSPPAPQAKPGIPARALARWKARVGLWVRDE